MTDTRASLRWPWLRSAIYGAVVALSPAVWVVETQSCSAPGESTAPVELTGIQLVEHMQVEPFDLTWMGLVVALAFAAPFFAYEAKSRAARLSWHVAGLLSGAFTTMLTIATVTFAIFAARVLRPAGHLAVVLAALPVIESIVRIVLTLREPKREK